LLPQLASTIKIKKIKKVVKKLSKKSPKNFKRKKNWFVGNPTTLFNPLGQKAQLEKLPHSYQFLSIMTFGHVFYYIKKR
jgi:hypothetical protein